MIFAPSGRSQDIQLHYFDEEYLENLQKLLLENKATWTADKTGFFGMALGLPSRPSQLLDFDGILPSDTFYERLSDDQITQQLPPSFVPATTPSILCQGLCAACRAFAFVTAIEGTVQRTGQPALSLSAASLYYGVTGGAPQGASTLVPRVLDVARYLHCVGIVPAAAWPWPPLWDPHSPHDGRRWKVEKFTYTTGDRATKWWLLNRGPMAATISVPPQFLLYHAGIYCRLKEMTNLTADHGICVIGYDDNKAAWLCQNSWSANWGENGLFWWPYDHPCGWVEATYPWGVNKLV